MTEDKLKYFFNTFRYQLPQTSIDINLHLLLTSTFGVKTFLSQTSHVKSAFPQTLKLHELSVCFMSDCRIVHLFKTGMLIGTLVSMNPSRLNVQKKLSLKHPLSLLLLTDRVRVTLLNLSQSFLNDLFLKRITHFVESFRVNHALHDVCSTECLTVPFYRDATSTTCSECFCSPNLVFESGHCMPFHSQLNRPLIQNYLSSPSLPSLR